MVTIAIPSRGRLHEPAVRILTSLGFDLSFINSSRSLKMDYDRHDLTVVLAHPKDAGILVQQGCVDLAITAIDIIAENAVNVVTLHKLNFGQCKIVLAVKDAHRYRCATDLANSTIATSYPNLALSWFMKHHIPVAVFKLHGAVELAPHLNLASAVVESFETGRTVQDNGLKVIETILASTAVLIGPNTPIADSRIEVLIDSFRTNRSHNDY